MFNRRVFLKGLVAGGFMLASSQGAAFASNILRKGSNKAEAVSLSVIPSGFPEIDRIVGGFHRGDLSVIAGRPCIGKSALGLAIANNVGLGMKKTVLIFSLELSQEECVIRMLCAKGCLNARAVRKGLLDRDDWSKLTGSASALTGAPIFISDSIKFSSPQEIRDAVQDMDAKNGVALIVIDYIQLMRGSGMHTTRQEEIFLESTSALKQIAVDFNVPVVALSQLHRSVDYRADQKPILVDLEQTIEKQADVVILLNRSLKYPPSQDADIMELTIAKNRHGEIRNTRLFYHSEDGRFLMP